MRVLYITQAFGPSGASDIFSMELVRELSKKVGVDVLTISYCKGELEGVKVFRFPVFGHHAFYKFEMPFLGMRKLLEITYTNRYDIVHSQELFPGWLGHMAKKRLKVPHVLVKEMASNYPGAHGSAVLLSERLSLPHLNFDRLVSWSRYMAEEFFEKWGIGKEMIEIIPGGIKLEDFKVDREEVRKRFDVDDKKVLVITKPFYRTNAIAITYVIMAMKYVVKKHPDTVLLIAGDGEYRSLLEDFIRRLKLYKNVRLLGMLNHKEALKLQRSADILPHSFVYEPTTSIALLESLASGVPVVVTSTGEARYLVKDVGILVRPKDPKDMARGILSLLDNPKLGKELAKKARKRIESEYTIEKVAGRYLKLYRELTAQ
ncbi:MAG: hypothetical protein DRP11_03040 [Candidatus Aenigmatarchaeota archaeon]|mgnify:CR=1 FL=1|nr:MAG: hypothetical protein DRP11_03040 [Candidatus Aenigmarchaeota archaeon]